MPTSDGSTARSKETVKAGRKRLFSRGSKQHGSFATQQPHRAIARTPVLRTGKNIRSDRAGTSPDLGWQLEAYDLAETKVGEAGYVMHLTANTGAMCQFKVVKLAEDSDPQATDDPRPLRVMRALVGPRGGTKEIIRRLFLHQAIAGEYYLVGLESMENSTSLGMLWEALSVRELTIDASGKPRRTPDGGAAKDLDPETTYVAHGWLSDSMLSGRATSQMKRALPVCRAIARHDQAVDAVSKSKLAAGLLFVPEGFDFVDEDGAVDELDADEIVEGDPEERADSFSDKLYTHLSDPIDDEGSDAAYQPLLVRGPAEESDKIRMIDLSRRIDDAASERLDKALARLARILDTPPEVLEGKGGLNHWTGYSIDADFLGKHVVPAGETLADFLTVGYLRPMLEDVEEMSPEEAATFALEFDPSAVTARADSEASGRALHDRKLISNDALLKASGYSDADKPSDEELKIRRIDDLLTKVPALAPQLVKMYPGFEHLDTSVLEAAAPAAGGPVPAEPAAPVDKVVDAQSGAEQPTPPKSTATIIRDLAVAADAAVDRAIERAGARVATAAKRDQGIAAKVKGVDYLNVFTKVGPAQLQTLGLAPDDLFAQAWDRFEEKTQLWIRDWATSRGVPLAAADEMGLAAATQLSARLTEWTVSTLHRGGPAVGANGLRVPDELVEDVVSLVCGAAV